MQFEEFWDKNPQYSFMVAKIHFNLTQAQIQESIKPYYIHNEMSHLVFQNDDECESCSA